MQGASCREAFSLHLAMAYSEALGLRSNMCLDSQVAVTRSSVVIEPRLSMMSMRLPHVYPSQAKTGSCPKARHVCQPRSASAGPLKKQRSASEKNTSRIRAAGADLHPKHGLVLHLTAKEAKETSSCKTGLGRFGQVRFVIEPTSPRDSTATWSPVQSRLT